jgi:hypothetical protein
MALANVQGKTSMVNYCKIKVGGYREEYIVHYNGNESSGLVGFKWVGSKGEPVHYDGVRKVPFTYFRTAKKHKNGKRNFWELSGYK